MTPGFAADNLRHSCGSDTDTVRYRPTCLSIRGTLSNGANNILSQLRVSVLTPAHQSVRTDPGSIPVATGGPSFVPHIRRVNLGFSKEQVSGIAARRIVTSMADEQTRRDRTVHQLEYQSVRGPGFVSNRDRSVPIAVECAGPFPARIRAIRLINVLPRIFRFVVPRLPVARPRAVSRLAIPIRVLKRLSALLTNAVVDGLCHKATLLGKAISERWGAVRETVPSAGNYSAQALSNYPT